jgi:hypothetical protein
LILFEVTKAKTILIKLFLEYTRYVAGGKVEGDLRRRVRESEGDPREAKQF